MSDQSAPSKRESSGWQQDAGADEDPANPMEVSLENTGWQKKAFVYMLKE